MDHQKNLFLNYQQKNFSICLNLIEAAPETARNSSHYKVLKAVCLVNLNKKFDEAHHILDQVLADENDNAFAHYCKGLAFFYKLDMAKAIPCFDKAIECDKNCSMGMAKMMKAKAEQKEILEVDENSYITKNAASGKKKQVIHAVKEMPSTVMETLTYIQTSSADSKEPNMESKREKSTEDLKCKPKITKATSGTDATNKTCRICSKTFSKTFSLSRHMQLHTGERPHKCDQCNFAFIQKSDLIRHIATHENLYAFECGVCKKQFKTKKNLQCHRVAHVQERPYQCRLCPKSFKLSKLLKFHENLHNASFAIGCDMCGKKFATKGYIISHMKTHSNFKPFGCNLCRHYYSSLSLLGMHFRENHGVGKGKV